MSRSKNNLEPLNSIRALFAPPGIYQVLGRHGSTVGIFVPTMIVVTTVSTRAAGTAPKEIFVPATIVGTIVLTKIVGTAVPTIIVETAYYWKSCSWDVMAAL